MPTSSPLRSLTSFAHLTLPAAFALATALSSETCAQCTYSWPAAPFGTGCNDAVTAATVAANGDLVVGGRFTDAGGVAANRIARWNGTTWSALGSGMNANVDALITLPGGDQVAGGTFTTSGGVTTNCIARWNGTTWSALGNGIDILVPLGSSVQALAVMQNGDLVVGGAFTAASGVICHNVARWNGTAWSALGSGTAGSVRALAVLPNGDLVAAGSFPNASGVVVNHIARWNGTTWSAFGTGLGFFGATALAVLPNGELVVGGPFVTAGGGAANAVARWNGVSWSALGVGLNGPVTSLLALPSGELIAGGVFTLAGGASANRIARWNGATWSTFGTGVDGTVHELLRSSAGDVVAAGEFQNASGNAATRVARVVSSCAPQSANLGAGCSGAGGLNTLVTTHQPLIGSSFRATGTGMPPFGFVLAVTGLSSTSLPLSLVLPQALPGCTLFTTADLIDVIVPVAGTASSAIALAYAPILVGQMFFHQYVPLELDLMLNITAVSASNALQLTIGTF